MPVRLSGPIPGQAGIPEAFLPFPSGQRPCLPVHPETQRLPPPPFPVPAPRRADRRNRNSSGFPPLLMPFLLPFVRYSALPPPRRVSPQSEEEMPRFPQESFYLSLFLPCLLFSYLHHPFYFLPVFREMTFFLRDPPFRSETLYFIFSFLKSSPAC